MKIEFSGSATSEAIELTSDLKLVGVFLPSAFAGSSLQLETRMSKESSTWLPVYAVDGASIYQVTASASRYIPFDPRVVAGLSNLRLKSSGSETMTGTSAAQGSIRKVG